MNISQEVAQYLQDELREYMAVTPMTEEESVILREWVSEGNSVHDNARMACNDGGIPMDFLEVYRFEKEEQELMASMTPQERDNYLRENYGVDSEKTPELTYDVLKSKAQRLYTLCTLFWDVLEAHGLQEEAREVVKQRIDDEYPFEVFDFTLD